MIRTALATSVAALALAASTGAYAKPIKSVEHFTTGRHAKVTKRVTVHTKTGVVDSRAKITKADGKTKTVSEKATPAATGGYTTSRTVTGFNGVSKTTTGHSTASTGHGGHGKA